MKWKTRQRIVRTVLALLTVWPLFHVGVTRAFDMNPWKFLGFGMYAVPTAKVQVSLFAFREGQLVPFRREEVGQEVMHATFRYSWRRVDLGTLARPDAIAQGLLKEHPEIEGVRVEIMRSYVDRDDGMLKLDIQPYDYFRE
jgi:hypothetical protein